MATLIPELIPQKATPGEKKIAKILQKLPEDCLVYYEPRIDKLYPDFIVISPRLGILILEVKDWSLDNIISCDSHRIVLRKCIASSSTNPQRQVREYMITLKKYCKKQKELIDISPLLAPSSSPHSGSFSFPFGNTVLLPNITKKAASHSELNKVLDKRYTFYQEDIAELTKLQEEALEKRLANSFEHTWIFEPLTEKQINILRSIIHPEIKISPTNQGQNHIFETDIRVLDINQEKHARNIGGGHRIIQGVAGSGKTLLLVYRAKILSTEAQNQPILFLCYNVSLAAYIRDILKNHAVEILHFDAWARQNNCVRARDEADDSLGERLLAYLNQTDKIKYKAILIDEAQDFAASWFKCVVQSLQNPVESDLLIVGDASQSLRKQNRFTWNSVGINAQGRTISKKFNLQRNYRNTVEIMRLASLFSEQNKLAITAPDETLSPIDIDLNLCVRHSSIKPTLVKCEMRREEITWASQLIEQILNGTFSDKMPDDIQPEQIGILYPYKNQDTVELLRTLIRQLNRFTSVRWLNESANTRFMVNEPGVKLQTIHSSKGLQYKVVIVLWADLLPRYFPDTNLEQELNLFYVALTRAEDYLFISCTNHSRFTATLQKSPECDYQLYSVESEVSA